MKLVKLAAGASWFLTLMVFAWPSALGASVARPISEAERVAVGLAAGYLAEGVVAWERALAKDSPLAALPEAERRAEIEVRLGPADGAEWVLATPLTAEGPDAAAFLIGYPSGLGEFLELELVEEDGEWRLLRIQSSVEPRPEPVNFEELFEDSSLSFPGLFWLWVGLALLIVPVLKRSGRAAGSWQPAALTLLLVVWSCSQEPGSSSGVAEIGPEEHEVRLGALRELRWQTAGATEAESRAAVPAEDLLLDVAMMWRAEEFLVNRKLNDAETVLQEIAPDSRYPRAELLRARLALLRDEAEASLKSYTRAHQLGGTFDTLMWETVEAQVLLGEPGQARATIAYLAETESRRAEVHYSKAYLLLADGVEEEADQTFRTAWALEPQGRDEIFTDPALAAFAARPSILPLLELEDPEEPRVTADDAGSNPLDLPPGVESRLYGRFLVLRYGDAVVEVPNGAPIAPESSGVARAGGRHREEQLAALAWLREQDLATLTTASQIELKRAELAGSALLEKERWAELLGLTEHLLESAETPSVEVAWFQIAAVRGLERHEEAKSLLVALAKRGIVQQQRDPGILIELAELYGETEDFETAIRLLKRASALASTRALDSRIRQFALDQRLTGNYKSYSSRHFDVRFPWETGEKYAIEVAYVLEEERRRLQRWIPVVGDEKIEVDLFPLVEFMNTYGTSIVGFFDGRVRVPLADLQSLHPKLVAILSHELAHAMIDSTSAGRAPNWFHEGLAQHVQMADQPTNYLTELRSASRSVSLPVLEPILRGFAEPQFVQMAYGQAAWLAHYLEVRSGPKVFGRLMNAFVRGLDTAQAIEAVVGVPYSEFEEAFWSWGTQVAPKAWPTEPRRYDKEMALAELSGRHPSRQAAGSSAKKRPLLLAPTGSRDQQMKLWHARYAAKALPVKRALAAVLRILDSESQVGLTQACLGLRQSLEPLLARGAVLNSPDPFVNSSLRGAFGEFHRAALECRAGTAPLLRVRIDKAMKELQTAANALAHFGLEP